VILADEIERQGLMVARLTPETRGRLAAVVPDYGSTNNPVDATATLVARMIGGERGLWTECFLALADDPNVDQIVIGLTMITGEAGATLADEVIVALEHTAKPVVVAWLGADLCREAFERLRAAGVPMFSSTTRAVRVAASLADHAIRREAEVIEPRDLLDISPLALNRTVLTEWQSQALLRAAGLECPWARLLESGGPLPESELDRGKRYVVKVQSHDIVHKTDAGAVLIGLESEEIEQAASQVLANAKLHQPDAQIDGVMLQEMVTGGLEMLLSVVRDPWFGLMLSVGMGGTLTELLGDVSLRRLPVSEDAIREMLDELRGAALLRGMRRDPPYDEGALIDAVERIAWLAESLGDRLEELEINPLLVLPEARGAVTADCLIRLRS
jgi:acyl-CoA synthetase (NDP forming)